MSTRPLAALVSKLMLCFHHLEQVGKLWCRKNVRFNKWTNNSYNVNYHICLAVILERSSQEVTLMLISISWCRLANQTNQFELWVCISTANVLHSPSSYHLILVNINLSNKSPSNLYIVILNLNIVTDNEFYFDLYGVIRYMLGVQVYTWYVCHTRLK